MTAYTAIWMLAASALAHGAEVLTFEKLSKAGRSAEPVVFGMPFPEGRLTDPARLELVDGARVLPVQATVTGRWPDGSVRWLFVRSLVDLPGNRPHQVHWRIAEKAAPQARGVEVRRLSGGSLEVDTGPLVARIPAEGFFPLADARLNGRPVWPAAGRMSGFAMRVGSRIFSTADAGRVKLEIESAGPVAAVIRVSGRHGGVDSPFDFSAELTFWKGKPYVAVSYRVLAARGAAEQSVGAWEWQAATGAEKGRLRLEAGRGIQASDRRVAAAFGLQDFRFQAVEHEFQSYWGDFWCDWTGAAGGLAVTLRQAQQNFPKAMEVTPGSLRISLYPAGKDALAFPLGAAKTHRMLFHFHSPDAAQEEISYRSLQFQIPDVPTFASDWYARCGVWDERVFEGPRSRRIEALVYDHLDNRPVGMGIWNFGDEVEWGYTGQGRGKDEVVWLNNEYDFAHLLFVEYARSGERRFLDYAEANAEHWRDVDIDHASPNPARRGGHIAHSARHRTGGVTPSHQWVEGLMDAWHYFGDRWAYEAALGIGDNILRAIESPRYKDPAQTTTREMGWALRAMLALYRETGEEKYLKVCRPLVSLFQRWHAEYPGMLAPYTAHTLVRIQFMNSLTLASLARYNRRFPDPALKKLILAETDELIANCRNATGVFYYKELPSLKFTGQTGLILELLGEAYLLSRDKRYLEAGLPELEYMITALNRRLMIHGGASEKFGEAGGGYSRVTFYPPGGKFLGITLMPVLQFLHAAKDTDLVRQTDYQLRLQ